MTENAQESPMTTGELGDVAVFDEDFFLELGVMRQEILNRLDDIESRQLPLPDILYHATTREDVRRIVGEGINPSSYYFQDGEAVSLSDDIEFALDVVEKTQGVPRDQLVVLAVATEFLTPSRVHNYLRSEDPFNPDPFEAAPVHEVGYDLTVPAEAICVVGE